MMASRFLVLDIESDKFLRSKSLEDNKSFIWHLPSNSEFDFVCGKGGYQAVVYASPAGKKRAHKYLKRFPMSANVVVKKDKTLQLGRESRELVLSKSDSTEAITSKLQELVEIQRTEMLMASQLKVRTLVEKLYSEVSPSSKEEYLESLLALISDHFSCLNVYWLGLGQFDYYVRQMWKVQKIRETKIGFDHHPKFVSHKGSRPADLSDTLQRLQGNFQDSWDTWKIPFQVNGGNDPYEPTFVLPVLGQNEEIIGHIVVVSPLDWPFGDETWELLGKACVAIGWGLGFAEKLAYAENMSYRDDVTDLYNQRYLQLVLDKEIERAKRSNDPFSVLFIDLDHFKNVNDTEGHLVGSKILVEIGKQLSKTIRSTDYGFRYGGDEFMLVLVGMDSNAAAKVAERIRVEIEETEFDVEGAKIRVTLSIGVASFPEHAQTKEEIVRLADEAMYYGKSKSRNIVYVAS